MEKLSAAVLLLLGASVGLAAPVEFEDRSDSLGFERGTESWGIAWGNLNRDVYPDLFNQGHRDFARLYRNTGRGAFEDVAMEYDVQMGGWWLANTQRDVHGATWGDYDNDGDDDLIVGDENEFFINDSESTGYLAQLFLESERAHASWIPSSTMATLISETDCDGNYVQFLDLDNDGTLDKICADADNFPEIGSSGIATALVPKISRVADSIVADFDNDLLTDIIVLRGSVRPSGADYVDPQSVDIWFRDGRDASVTLVATGDVKILIDGAGGGAFLRPDVINHDGASSLSTRVRDIDISYDLATGRYTFIDDSDSQHYIRVRANAPISNLEVLGLGELDLPSVPYYGKSSGSGIVWGTSPGLDTAIACVSLAAADFDNDMDKDLYMACREGVRNTANLYFDNLGNGTFAAVAIHGAEGPVGTGDEFGVAESVAIADYDVDGFLDIAVVNGALFYPYGIGGPDSLFRNKGNQNRWIQIDLVGRASNRNGMGAKVFVTAGGVTQLGEQNGGYHRWSQNHQRLHFGLAGNAIVDEIRIEWPSGIVDTFTNVGSNVVYAAREGGSLAAVVHGPEVVTVVQDGEECGLPPYTISYGPAMLLWRDCGTTRWRLRLRSGLGRLVDDVPQVATGSITADGEFALLNGNGLEPADSLALANPMQIEFDIAVRDEPGAASKTIVFDTAGQSSTCLNFSRQDMSALIIGSSGKRLDPPFDLANSLRACDTDQDGISNVDDPDDDNDGFVDEADAFPSNAGEWADTDGDGVGNNGDAFPANPSEQSDADGDGIGDNSDIDADNDSIPDITEFLDPGFTRILEPFSIPPDGGSATQTVNLAAEGVTIGSSVLISNVLADGDINGSNEYFTLAINGSEYLSGALLTEQQCVGAPYPITTPITEVVSVIDIGGGVPGIEILGTSSAGVGLLENCSGLGVEYQLTVSGIPGFGMDQDGDWVLNVFDLDTDNDTIPDVVEAGLADLNGDFIVDDLFTDQGSVDDPPDSDADGLPDFLDLESSNPLNDGTDFDISSSAFALFDTNNDGQLGSADDGGGIDIDMDGIDDLIDRDTSIPGSPAATSNNRPLAASQSLSALAGEPLAVLLTGSDPDADSLSFTIVASPSHGSLEGSPPHLTYTANPGFVGVDSILFAVDDGSLTSVPATILLNVAAPTTALAAWQATTGGVSVSANTLAYSGSPAGWNKNTANSVPFSELGLYDEFVVHFRLDSDPGGSIAIFGLGIEESGASWRDVDFGFRIDNGTLSIRESGDWRTGGEAVAQDDVLAIRVAAGIIEYRLNGISLYTGAYAGTPDFYVDSSFNSGPISVSATIEGASIPVLPPTSTAITSWSGASGGVAATGASLSYSGAPSGWSANTINSAALSTSGTSGDFEVRFEVASDPADTTWAIGLGEVESGPGWRDVDFALRSSGGNLTIYESGTWRASVGVLQAGSMLSIGRKGAELQYRLDGVVVYETALSASMDYYIDSSFKSGAIDLTNFEIITPRN